MVQIIYSKCRITSVPKILMVFVLLLFNVGIYAQSNKKAEDLLIEAKKQLTSKNYQGTIKICNQIFSVDPQFKDAHLTLADVYSQLDSVNQEILHLNKAGEIGREWDVVFRLGEAYYKKGDYSDALRYYNIYSDYKYIPEKRQFLLACKMASCKFEIYSANNTEVKSISNTGAGSGSADVEFWPTQTQNGKTLVFMRVSKDPIRQPEGKFYTALPDSEMWNIAKIVNDSVLFDNEGIQKLSPDSKILFFTACNRQDGLGDCDIYLIKFEDGKWGSPVNAGNMLNSEKWDGQPTFYPGINTLYFSSERNGGKGKKDIWKAELTGFSDSGTPEWKNPVNLGNLVNTTGDEVSPFVYANKNIFYFASDGHPGLGGMDLFSTEIDEKGNTSNLKNLGYPINTHYDDDGLTLNHICDTTYFTSARQTEKGMEIFAFNLDRGLATSPVAYVKVKVVDAKTKKALQTTVKLEFQPFKTNRSQIQVTDESGETMFCLQLNRNYAFTVSAPGYMYLSKFLNESKVNSINEPQVLDIELQPIEIGAEVQLYNIYYETDSFRILPQSEPELQNLVTFLKNNAKMKIEIQGHTDSSGNPENNRILSERRAKSVVDYLVKNGIALNRLKSGGYGDKIPIASNETPEGRMLNRRTTIKILE